LAAADAILTARQHMTWLYEKGTDRISLQTGYDNRTLQFVLRIVRSEGTTVERFERMEQFRGRLVALERSLVDDAWRQSGPPVIDTVP
jgi:hypothetical protein